MQFTVSIDVEKDLHTPTYLGVTEGLNQLDALCTSAKIKPILFVTADCIEKYPGIFKKYAKKGWEISLHGYSHERFDEMSTKKKEEEIKKSIAVFKKIGIRPKGFRAPQHSIDDVTLDLLERYAFEYDSSYTPLNLLQLLFFPKKIKLWLRSFFSPRNRYFIRDHLEERPPSAFFIPFVSLTVRVFPVWILRKYFWIIRKIHKEPMFYAHSWDFIALPESRIDQTFSHEVFIKKLGKLLNNER